MLTEWRLPLRSPARRAIEWQQAAYRERPSEAALRPRSKLTRWFAHKWALTERMEMNCWRLQTPFITFTTR
jgi:hypothetical protein